MNTVFVKYIIMDYDKRRFGCSWHHTSTIHCTRKLALLAWVCELTSWMSARLRGCAARTAPGAATPAGRAGESFKLPDWAHPRAKRVLQIDTITWQYPQWTRAEVKYVLSNTNKIHFFQSFKYKYKYDNKNLIKYKYKYKYTMRLRQNWRHFACNILQLILFYLWSVTPGGHIKYLSTYLLYWVQVSISMYCVFVYVFHLGPIS